MMSAYNAMEKFIAIKNPKLAQQMFITRMSKTGSVAEGTTVSGANKTPQTPSSTPSTPKLNLDISKISSSLNITNASPSSPLSKINTSLPIVVSTPTSIPNVISPQIPDKIVFKPKAKIEWGIGPTTPNLNEKPKSLNPLEGLYGIVANVDIIGGLKGLAGAASIVDPFASKKQKTEGAINMIKSYASGQEQWQYYKQDYKRLANSPAAWSLYTLPISWGTGAGLGALKAAYPTAGKLTSIGVGGFFAGSTIKGGLEAQKSGNLGNYLAQNALLFGVGGPLFKKGYSFGSGRVSERLYLQKTYEPGSKEFIRLKSANIIGRNLQNVKSLKTAKFEFSNIERFEPKHTKIAKEYFIKNPKDIIGGSGAAYSQVEGARLPRDLDLLVQRRGGIRGVLKKLPEGIKTKQNPLKLANIEKTSETKKFFGELQKGSDGEHVIDIHGREMYEPGKQLQFGFSSKESIKIGRYNLMRAGEQLFRKGIAGTTKETEYRWFKDIPDFITTAESQIKSAQSSILTRGKAVRAAKALDIFKGTLKGTEYEPGKTTKKTIFEPKLPEFVDSPNGAGKITRKLSSSSDYLIGGGNKVSNIPSYTPKNIPKTEPYINPNIYNTPPTTPYKPKIVQRIEQYNPITPKEKPKNIVYPSPTPIPPKPYVNPFKPDPGNSPPKPYPVIPPKPDNYKPYNAKPYPYPSYGKKVWKSVLFGEKRKEQKEKSMIQPININYRQRTFGIRKPFERIRRRKINGYNTIK